MDAGMPFLSIHAGMLCVANTYCKGLRQTSHIKVIHQYVLSEMDVLLVWYKRLMM